MGWGGVGAAPFRAGSWAQVGGALRLRPQNLSADGACGQGTEDTGCGPDDGLWSPRATGCPVGPGPGRSKDNLDVDRKQGPRVGSLLPWPLFSLTLIWEYRPLCRERVRTGKRRIDPGISMRKLQTARKLTPSLFPHKQAEESERDL